MALDKNSKIAVKLGLVVGLMLAASFASVPFYRLFCQLTGFGGTAQRVAQVPDVKQVSTRMVTVTMNADVAPDLPWEFKPLDKTITVRVGEPVTTHYHVKNLSQKILVGTASHNIQPDRVAAYFDKVECFCFTEQILQAGESRDLPVTFFIDPDLAADKAQNDVQAITLSYTFFLAKDQSKAKLPIASVAAAHDIINQTNQ
jgi:cytochrome c oxidase assembly protein subunit 11